MQNRAAMSATDWLSEFLALRAWMRSMLRQKGYHDDVLHEMDFNAEKGAVEAAMFPARMPRSVRVRIAVCVAADGTWNSCGWAGDHGKVDDAELAAHAADCMSVPSSMHFIEADIPLPTTIHGEVKT